ncbi:molybdopterin guanine dinucleotide synthesis [Rhodobacter sp. Har01]|uniref:molybdopterin guanine dinucleotide synthesis n=1 Tax=Rhodobacter sp. Har01 TaxID=2883999 RepID=UPI001D06864D|nr:molybdopterin guanine dinucleotide synthesis [Rhodobacter sp. Har01]MCB6176726.1 molybdopterin guanine dinucleotide synthesis [Rhodobacter sp. Har01]
MSFDSILVVDWSGGADRGPRPVKDAIWAALARAERPAFPPVYLRNRIAAEDWLARTLTAERANGRRVLAAFDFPFGYPAGFAARVVGRPDPLALWDFFAAELPPGRGAAGEPCRFALAGRLNGLFPGIGPFWFNGRRDEAPGLPRKGRARQGHAMEERRLAEHQAKGAFTCWQMGGAGAVGSQAMTGQAALARLRARFGADLAVWPFQPWAGAGIVLAEVWPSLLAREIAAGMGRDEVKDAAQVRLLAAALAGLQAEGGLGAALDSVPPAAAEEGWILGLGHEVAFARALLSPSGRAAVGLGYCSAIQCEGPAA